MTSFPTNASPLIGETEPVETAPWEISFGGGRVPTHERVRFTNQLAMMVGAGVSVASALKSIKKQSQNEAFRRVLDQLEEDVLGGSGLSVAMRQHPRVFDGAYVATVAAGEASGKMREVLVQLSELQQAEQKLQRTIRGMMIYPILLTVVASAVISILVIFVLPRFASIFDQYEITLPLVTRALLAVADEARTRWWVWGPLLLGSGIGAVAAWKSEQGRTFLDTMVLKAPGLKRVSRTLIGARACRMLGLLLSSGVPLFECLGLLRQAVSNRSFNRLTYELEEAVTNGRPLSEPLEGTESLPPSATELIATAEKTGRLGEVCQMMGLHYEEEGEELARQIISAIEPLVTIVMGAVVAVIVLAVMLPVFNIATLAQH